MKLERKSDPDFPNASTIGTHFPSQADLASGLRELARSEGWADVTSLLPDALTPSKSSNDDSQEEGLVYLLKSGNYYKIGRSSEIERRVKEVSTALPEKVTLVHSIKTDDPAGIEGYWHRRFISKRANGEWFSLSADDVRVFIRRKFQ